MRGRDLPRAESPSRSRSTDQGGQNGSLVGNVIWRDADHFNFRLAGAPTADPGLDFAR